MFAVTQDVVCNRHMQQRHQDNDRVIFQSALDSTVNCVRSQDCVGRVEVGRLQRDRALSRVGRALSSRRCY